MRGRLHFLIINHIFGVLAFSVCCLQIRTGTCRYGRVLCFFSQLKGAAPTPQFLYAVKIQVRFNGITGGQMGQGRH